MPTPQTESALPAVAVIIIGRNEGSRLRRCLESVQAMHYPPSLLTITYVDSDSSDGSVELARGFGARVITLQGPTTAARGRNAGLQLVEAPFVLFLDGDTILHPNFLQAALQAIADPTVAGVGGHRQESDRAGSLYNAVFDMDWVTKVGVKPNFGGDALVRVEALRRVGGFNDSLIGGEEPDVCRRIRALCYVILHIDHPMTTHDLNIHSFGKYWRRSLRTGFAYAQVSSFYAHTDDPLWLYESRHNLVRGVIWSVLPIVILLGAILMHSKWVLLLLLLAAVLILRTTWQARSRGCGPGEALAYGAHAHLQHIPILIGQLQFWMSRPRAKSSAAQVPPADQRPA